MKEANTSGPVPHKEHPGTPRLHEETFVNGRGIFSNVHYRDPAETISEAFPVWLTTGRTLSSPITRERKLGRAHGIDYLLPEESLEVNPADLEKWELADGEWCKMSSARGSINIKVKADKSFAARAPSSPASVSQTSRLTY